MLGLTNDQLRSLRDLGYYTDTEFKDSKLTLHIYYDTNIMTPDQAKSLLESQREIASKSIEEMMNSNYRSCEEDVQVNTEYVNDRGNK